MIASLIVGYFGTGIYMFIVLFLIGGVIPVQPDHPIILPGGVGIRMTVDMDTIKYALEGIWQIPFAVFMIVASALVVLYLVWSQYIRKLKPGQARLSNFKFALYAAIAVVILAVFAYQAATKGRGSPWFARCLWAL